MIKVQIYPNFGISWDILVQLTKKYLKIKLNNGTVKKNTFQICMNCIGLKKKQVKEYGKQKFKHWN